MVNESYKRYILNLFGNGAVDGKTRRKLVDIHICSLSCQMTATMYLITSIVYNVDVLVFTTVPASTVFGCAGSTEPAGLGTQR